MAVETIIFRKAKHIDTKVLTHYLNVFNTILFPLCGVIQFKFI